MRSSVLASLLAIALPCATSFTTSVSALPALRSQGPALNSRLSASTLRGGGLTMSGKIEVKKPTEEEKKACSNWPTWGCGVSKFPWSYSERETCLVLEGEVTVTPDGGGEPVKIVAGDMAVFPKGMSCTWDVTKAINKHYNFD